LLILWISSARFKEMKMMHDLEVRLNGMQALINALGPVDAERFVMLLNRDQLDYTEWRKQLWRDETVESLAKKAHALRAARNEH
jgi:hypothetical protein